MVLYLEINDWSPLVQLQEPQKMKWEKYLPLKPAVPVLLGETCTVWLPEDSMNISFEFTLFFSSWHFSDPFLCRRSDTNFRMNCKPKQYEKLIRMWFWKSVVLQIQPYFSS
jgi:hypothetical protein